MIVYKAERISKKSAKHTKTPKLRKIQKKKQNCKKIANKKHKSKQFEKEETASQNISPFASTITDIVQGNFEENV